MPILMAFTAQQAARLANISVRKLRYWEQTDVFRPEYLERRERGPFRRIYTFRDLVSLRTLALLRAQRKLPLPELRRATEYLQRFSASPWTDLGLRIYGKQLAFRNPNTGQWETADARGQLVLTIDMEDVSRESEREARVLMQRMPEHFGRIVRNRYVMSNAWVFSGTRIPIEAVLGLHAAGYSAAAILAQYPTLDGLDIHAALAFDPPAQAA